GQIGDELAGVGIADDGSQRQRDDDVLAVGAGLVAALARAAVARLVAALVTKVEKSGEIVIDSEPDVAALSAVTAGPTAARNVVPAAKRDGAGAAVTGTNRDRGLVDEPRHATPLSPEKAQEAFG